MTRNEEFDPMILWGPSERPDFVIEPRMLKRLVEAVERIADALDRNEDLEEQCQFWCDEARKLGYEE